MENLNFENNSENTHGIIRLEGGNNLQMPLFGRSIEAGAKDLIKIFAVIRHIKESKIEKDKIEETARDLFNEFGVQIFEYENIFSDTFVNQILAANKIDTLETQLNGLPIIIKPDSTVESVMETWRPKSKSNEGSSENDEKIKKLQESADAMYSSIDSLDFQNLEKVINWLYEYNTYVANVGVEIHSEEIAQKFASKGYSIEENDKTDFMLGEVLQDKELYGKAMVAFMLQNLGIFREQQMKQAIDDWKKGTMHS